jgi:hypothetical protein
LNQGVLPGVCAITMIVLVPSHSRVPAAKRARKNTVFGGANEAAEKFGPLKAILGTIPALFANREVRPYSPTWDLSLTNISLGVRSRRKQDQPPPLSCSDVRRAFQFASSRCARPEAPG